MKKIESIIRPHLLEAVKNSLEEVGVTGMTITEVKGYGRQKGHTETYRGVEYQIHFLPKIKIEIVLADQLASPAIDAIAKAAKTGRFGDGKIFVTDIAEVVRIRTGEHGEEAV